MEEVLRVLVPNGVAMIKSDGEWKKTVKPRPDNIDEWSHYLHDATGNSVAHDDVVAPPRHLQWVGSPRWSRHHDRMASMSALVSTGGRMFYIMDEGQPDLDPVAAQMEVDRPRRVQRQRALETRHRRLADPPVAAQERSDAACPTIGLDRRYRLRHARIQRTADGAGCGHRRDAPHVRGQRCDRRDHLTQMACCFWSCAKARPNCKTTRRCMAASATRPTCEVCSGTKSLAC